MDRRQNLIVLHCKPVKAQFRTYPVRCAEIHSFSKVISLIEAAVVGSGEGDDKLSSALVGTNNLPTRNRDEATRTGQQTWSDEEHNKLNQAKETSDSKAPRDFNTKRFH